MVSLRHLTMAAAACVAIGLAALAAAQGFPMPSAAGPEHHQGLPAEAS